jgi:hypothetical protein
VVKGRNAEAVDAFKQANPMLKSNTITYARNLYQFSVAARLRGSGRLRIGRLSGAGAKPCFGPAKTVA